jgi:hypothetical protein
MKTIEFSIAINAPKHKVWDSMLSKETYREWAKEFHEGSDYEGNWEKGSEMRFTGPEENGKVNGMYSRINENKLYEYLSIEHLGMIADGVIDTTSDQVKQWAPSFENYTFTENDGETVVKVDMQTPEEYAAMFGEMWPRALNALKKISERN